MLSGRVHKVLDVVVRGEQVYLTAVDDNSFSPFHNAIAERI